MKSAQAWAAHLCNLIVLGGFFAFAIGSYDALPEFIPVHYGADGRPDRSVETSWGAWLLMPVLSILLTLLLYGIAIFVSRWGPRHPRWVNVPAKKVYLRLPPEEQAIIIRRTIWALPWIALPMNFLLFYTQWLSLQVALGTREGLHLPTWLLAVLAVPVFAVVPLLGAKQVVLDAADRHGIPID